MDRAPPDLVVVGAGPAGLMTTIFAADRGLSVTLLDRAPEIGGALLISRGQISGAGTRRQAERGIIDTPEAHFADAMRISGGTADPVFLEMATRLQGPMIDWLVDHGFAMREDSPRPVRGSAGYRTPRSYSGVEGGRSILAVLARQLDAQIESGRVALATSVEVDGLIDRDGAIAGVRSGAREYRGRAVVLASGGYGANPALFARLHPGGTLWSGSYAHATGRGIALGLAAGGTLTHAGKYQPNFGGVFDPTTDPPRWRAPGGLTAEDRLPWEIVVNARGERFYAEDTTDGEARATALLAQPEARGFAIYDQAIRDAAPSLFRYFPPAKAARFYGADGPIHRADDLAALAEACGIDPATLAATVTDYNRAAASGDDRLGRTHMPLPIAARPFYALPIAAYTVRGFAGLGVDTAFRVIDGGGGPIPGLYAVGELLGAQLSGKGGVGGMALAPALAFGRLLGETIFHAQG